jgi:pimeloyl-ACP methyl ester carboxylesterase
MQNPRIYGRPPYTVAVVHGGPGAAGEMAPVARELAPGRGVLEPLQTRFSVDGQIEELRTLLETAGNPPVTLIGFSWGAWLSLLMAARHPGIARKLILVSSGSLREADATGIQRTREGRLGGEERVELQGLIPLLSHPAAERRHEAFARFGALMSKADACDPIPEEPAGIDFQPDVFQRVWPEAAELRRNGALLEAVRQVRCAVVAIHGEQDPHPADGVRQPLAGVLADFRFVLLPNCGHRPWAERQAREKFYRIVEEELAAGG